MASGGGVREMADRRYGMRIDAHAVDDALLCTCVSTRASAKANALPLAVRLGICCGFSYSTFQRGGRPDLEFDVRLIHHDHDASPSGGACHSGVMGGFEHSFRSPFERCWSDCRAGEHDHMAALDVRSITLMAFTPCKSRPRVCKFHGERVVMYSGYMEYVGSRARVPGPPNARNSGAAGSRWSCCAPQLVDAEPA